MSDTNDDVKIALDEMRLNMQQSLDAGDAIDQKLSYLVVGSGAVLALVGTLQLSLSYFQSGLYRIIFLAAIALYVFAVLLTLFAAGPQSYKLPIAPEWDELQKQILGRPERDILLTLLSGYVDQIQYNRRINQRKARAYRLCLLLLPVTVVLLAVLLFVK